MPAFQARATPNAVWAFLMLVMVFDAGDGLARLCGALLVRNEALKIKALILRVWHLEFRVWGLGFARKQLNILLRRRW
jgi:hypothetical protein